MLPTLQEYITAMDAVHIKAGLKLVMDMAGEGNKYMQDSKPWELRTSSPSRCARIINLMARFIRLVATLMEPFMPGFTDKVAATLNLPHCDIPDSWDPDTLCPEGADDAPGCGVPDGHRISKPTPLFSVISSAEVETFRSRFGGAPEAAAAVTGGLQAAVVTPASTAPVSKSKSGSKPAARATEALPDIARIDLRVGVIQRAWPHPESDKLWCEEVDIGEATPRRIASGLRHYYDEAGMTNRRIVVVANLKPRPMAGFESQGMVLCASNADRTVVEFIEPPAGAKVRILQSFLLLRRGATPDSSLASPCAQMHVSPGRITFRRSASVSQ